MGWLGWLRLGLCWTYVISSSPPKARQPPSTDVERVGTIQVRNQALKQPRKSYVKKDNRPRNTVKLSAPEQTHAEPAASLWVPSPTPATRWPFIETVHARGSRHCPGGTWGDRLWRLLRLLNRLLLLSWGEVAAEGPLDIHVLTLIFVVLGLGVDEALLCLVSLILQRPDLLVQLSHPLLLLFHVFVVLSHLGLQREEDALSDARAADPARTGDGRFCQPTPG
jgi:hypothetical protein